MGQEKGSGIHSEHNLPGGKPPGLCTLICDVLKRPFRSS
jgi:hypothetical protein